MHSDGYTRGSVKGSCEIVLPGKDCIHYEFEEGLDEVAADLPSGIMGGNLFDDLGNKTHDLRCVILHSAETPHGKEMGVVGG